MSVVDNEKLMEVAKRIREMREISGFSVEEMAERHRGFSLYLHPQVRPGIRAGDHRHLRG